ncbi:hypothetical protein I2W78_02685 [Streptomyces spinoverrucosus]|uniref:hypothetical protein n=1 Tax=Streptomyces spinoverrucosus TaxID=284043 RepID=UPI0018C3A9E1|nr:hypothetical protein [Streptomyces spinoverrucosus]MBG0850789.1 hypothetical protein [Streptomyces spinoverrucosus]
MTEPPVADKACVRGARTGGPRRTTEEAIMKRIQQEKRPRPPRRPAALDLRTPSGRPLPY